MKKTTKPGRAVRCHFGSRRVLAYPFKDDAGLTVWSEFLPGDKVIFRPERVGDLGDGAIEPWPSDSKVHCVRALDLSPESSYEARRSGRRWAGVYLVGHFGATCVDGTEQNIPPYGLLPLAEVQANNRARLAARKGGAA